MEGYGAVSNRVNRKLTRKRPFRNIERKAPALKNMKVGKNTLTIADRTADAAKWKHFGNRAKTRFLLIEGIIYMIFFGLVIFAVYYFFL